MKRLVQCFVSLLAVVPAFAWDYEGHRIVSQLALASLPKDFPAFTRTAAAEERVAFLSGEPDRWRNSPNAAAKHVLNPDHFIDLDDLALYGLAPERVSRFRYEFVEQLAAGRRRFPDRFPRKDSDHEHTRDLVGFLPWSVNENFARLQSAFSYLKAYQQFGGTPDEIANAQQNVLYYMGVLAHYAGDAAQPLHNTKHFNGWVGPNPWGYATNRTIHSWIDGGFIRRAEIRFPELRSQVRAARPIWNGGSRPDSVFAEAMQFCVEQSRLVERLYQLDRDGELSPGRARTRDGRNFIAGQLVKGGQFLGDLWLSAWQSAPTDTYLRGELTRRQNQRGRDN